MFNFASKVFNAIGDLVSDVDPTKPAQPSQPSTQQPSPQRRFSGGDARFYQIKSQPRFPTPQTQDDHLPRLGSSASGTSASASGGIGIGGGHVRPSSAPVYRYPTTTAHTTPSYRPERYEESKFKAPDIDYNEGEFLLFSQLSNFLLFETMGGCALLQFRMFPLGRGRLTMCTEMVQVFGSTVKVLRCTGNDVFYPNSSSCPPDIVKFDVFPHCPSRNVRGFPRVGVSMTQSMISSVFMSKKC